MKQKNKLAAYFVPSWIVNVIAVTVAVVVTAGVILLLNFQSSTLRLQILDVQERSIVDQQQGVYANITVDQKDTSFIGSLPLLITWAFIGLAVYFGAIAVAKMLGHLVSVREQSTYVNASPSHIRRQLLMRFGIRLVALAAWLGFVQLSVQLLVPYALASAAAAASELSALSSVYALLSAMILYVVVTAQAVFIRFVLLRPRILG